MAMTIIRTYSIFIAVILNLFFISAVCLNLYSIIVLDEVDQLTQKALYSLFDLNIVLIGIANTLKITTACKYLAQPTVI